MVCQSFGSVGNTPPPPALPLFTAISSAVIFVLGTTGNFGIVLTIVKDPLSKLHNSFNYFLLNLALSDLLLSVVTMPIGVTLMVQEYLEQEHSQYVYEVLHVSFFMSGTASLLSLIALSVDRYVAIKHHMQYKSLLTGYRCAVVCVCICVFSLSFPFLYFLKTWDYTGYLMFFAHSAVIVALVILIGTQIQTKIFLRKRSRHVITEDAENNVLVLERKISRVYIMILSFFISLYMPSIVMTYILHFCTHCDCTVQHVLRDLAFLFISANSCVNPFIYAFRIGTFRKSLKMVFCREEKPKSIKTVFRNLFVEGRLMSLFVGGNGQDDVMITSKRQGRSTTTCSMATLDIEL